MSKRSRKQRKDDKRHPGRKPPAPRPTGPSPWGEGGDASAGAEANGDSERPPERVSRRGRTSAPGERGKPAPWRTKERSEARKKSDRTVLLIFLGLALGAGLLLWWGTRPSARPVPGANEKADAGGAAKKPAPVVVPRPAAAAPLGSAAGPGLPGDQGSE